MSRAHIHGYDSNADQFERTGNPWHGEPKAKVSTKVKRALKKLGKPEARPGLPRRPERFYRSESEAMEHLQCRAALAARIKAASGTSRTVVGIEKSPTLAKPEPLTREIRHPARTELSRWQQFERQVTRCEQRGAVLKRLAEGQERHRVRDEKARLRSIIKAAEARLASL